jgi:hypothetical protein
MVNRRRTNNRQKVKQRPDNNNPNHPTAQEFPADRDLWPPDWANADYEDEDEQATFRIQIDQVEDADDQDYSDNDNGSARQ